MPKIGVNGVNFHYWQSGQGPDMLMIHGLGGNLAAWHLTIVSELQREYRVTTYDLRGHGRSDAPPTGYSTADQAADLRGIMDALRIEQAHLVGHSLGGDIALHFAALYPRRVMKLVMVEAALISPLAHLYRGKEWGGYPQIAQALGKLLGTQIPEDKQHDFEYLLERLIELPIIYGPARGQPRDEELVLRVANILKPMLYGYDGKGNLTLENLASILHPTLLIYEANSIAVLSHDVLRDRLPNCTSAIIPAGNLQHFTVLENPDLILKHAKAFLQTEETRAPSMPERGSGGSI